MHVDAPPPGMTKLTEWIEMRRDALGRHYTSEMARRADRFRGVVLTEQARTRPGFFKAGTR